MYVIIALEKGERLKCNNCGSFFSDEGGFAPTALYLEVLPLDNGKYKGNTTRCQTCFEAEVEDAI